MNINNLIKIIIKEIWNYCDLQKYSVFNLFKSNKWSNHDFVAVVIIPIAVDLSIHILLTGIFLRFLFEIYKRKMGKTNSQNSYIDNGSDDVSECTICLDKISETTNFIFHKKGDFHFIYYKIKSQEA